MHTCIDFSTINIIHSSYLTKIESTLTHYNHPKFIIYFKIHSGCYTILYFGHYIMIDIPHYTIIQSIFTALKIIHALSTHLLHPPEKWLVYISLSPEFFFFFPECHIIRIIQFVGFLDWLLSFSNVQLKFLYVFSCLDRSFIFNIK